MEGMGSGGIASTLILLVRVTWGKEGYQENNGSKGVIPLNPYDREPAHVRQAICFLAG